MATYTDVMFLPTQAFNADGWSNPTHAMNTSTSSYAYSKDLTMVAPTYIAYQWNAATFSSIPTAATISAVKVKCIFRVSSAGTGDWMGVEYQYSTPSSFSTGSLAYEDDVGSGSDFDTSFTTVTHTLKTKSSLKNGFTALLAICHNRFNVQKVYLASVQLLVTYTVPEYTITVKSSSDSYGTVSGGGTVESGKTLTISATAKSGYKFTKWNDGNTSNPRTITVSGNATYTAYFEANTHTVNFKNDAGTILNTYSISNGGSLTQIPGISKAGYDFVGWMPCAPAKKTDGSVLDSQQYTGESSSFAALSKDYKYTDKLAVHIEAYMSDWSALSGTNKQIISCTDGGGWAIGMYAGGTEIHTGSYTSIDLGLTSLTSGWHSFDIVFANGVFTAYVDGVQINSKSTSSSTVNYNANNTIFVGGEAGSNDTTIQDAALNFVGLISNVFIANQGSKLDFATANTQINSSVDYYPVWRLNPEQKKNQIYIGDKLIKEVYIGTSKVKEVYIGDIKIYG